MVVLAAKSANESVARSYEANLIKQISALVSRVASRGQSLLSLCKAMRNIQTRHIRLVKV